MFVCSVCIFFFVLFIAIKKINSMKLISPVFWLVVSWGFVFVMKYTSGLDYKYNVSSDSVKYIILCLLLFFLSYYMAYYTRWKNRHYKRNGSGEMNLNLATAISVIGMTLCVVSHIMSNGFDFGVRNDNFSASFVSNLGTYASLLGIYVWIYSLIDAIIKNNNIKIHHIICLFAGMSGALVSGNRWGVFYGMFSSVLAYLYALKCQKKYKYNKYIICGGVILVVISVVYFDYVIQKRFGIRDMVVMYDNVFNTTLSLNTQRVLSFLGPFKRIFEQMIYYFSQEINWFGQIYDSYTASPSWGAYEFHYVARRFETGSERYFSACDLITRIGRSYGVKTGVYRTFLTGLLVDFGKGGTCVIMVLIGWLMGKSQKSFVKNQSVENVTKQIILCLGCVFSVIASPFSDGWAFIFYWMLLIPLIKRIKIIPNENEGII